MKNESGKILEIPTQYFGYVELKSGQSLVAWERPDGEKVDVVVDGELGDIQYYKDHGVTPFALTQSEYDTIMSTLTPSD